MTVALREMLKAALTTVAVFLIMWLPSRVFFLFSNPAYPKDLSLWQRILVTLGHAADYFAPLFLLMALVERGAHWYLYARRPRHQPQDRGWLTHAREAVTTSATTCGLFAILGVGAAAIFGGRDDISGAAAVVGFSFVILTPAVLVMRRLTER